MRREGSGTPDTPWEAMGDTVEVKLEKTSGRQVHHPTQTHMWGDKGRQGLAKVETPSNKGTKREMADIGKQ